MIRPGEYLERNHRTAQQYRVRRYQSGDLAGVGAVEQMAFGDRCYPDFLFVQLADIFGRGFLVACRDDEIVGYVIAVPDAEEFHRGWILSLAVATGHRGLGAADRLMTAAEHYLTGRRCTESVLTVDPHNAPALHLYTRRGYLEIGRQNDHFGPGEHRLLLRARLAG